MCTTLGGFEGCNASTLLFSQDGLCAAAALSTEHDRLLLATRQFNVRYYIYVITCWSKSGARRDHDPPPNYHGTV